MNNIHEKDWAEDSWGAYSGMDNNSDWCIAHKEVDDKPVVHTDDNVHSESNREDRLLIEEPTGREVHEL